MAEMAYGGPCAVLPGNALKAGRRGTLARENTYRLPRTVTPRRYALRIAPDLEHEVFSGTAEIEVEVHEPVSEFVLNGVDVSVEEARLTLEATESAAEVEYRKEDERLVLKWSQTISPGTATLKIQYNGLLAKDLRGFYRTAVKDSEGKQVLIASTQMEATDARRVFPCWDEPDLKAVFAIQLVVNEDLTALSNSREISSESKGDGTKLVTFADTIPMSTYLVALVVGPFVLTEPQMAGSVPVRIAARPGFSDMVEWPLTEATGIVSFFEDYFGIPYAGDKLDHVGIPDFAAGAMENLGCVTYREELLLVDPQKSSPDEQMQVHNVIAHETAHMWFGDLVTMRWWNGLWLNEAFATFMSNLATDALHPEWDMWNQFARGRDFALVVDALESTRSIEFSVGSPAEVSNMFDVLTYQKGGSILRMMEQYLGPDVFRRGIQRYIDKHRFANTETGDLWDALEEASGQPVRSVMDSWVFQGGFPLIQAALTVDGRRLTLRQKQFRYQGDGNGGWKVPVVIGVRLEDGRLERQRVLVEDAAITVEIPHDMACVVVNLDGWGFYRVAYDRPLWDRLMRYLPELSPLERLALVDDAWAAVMAGEVELRHAAMLWRALGDERDPDVWNSVATSLSNLRRMGTDQDDEALAQLAREIAGPVFDQVGWVAGSDEDVRLGRTRAVLVRILGTIGQDAAVQERARALFNEHLTGTSLLSPSLLDDVVRVVAASGQEAEWEIMHKQYLNPATPQDLSRYLYALGRFRDPDLIQRTLAFYLSDEVKTQDRAMALGSIMMSRQGAKPGWDAVESHWDSVKKGSPFMMAAVIQPLAYFVDQELGSRAVQWVRSHPIPEAAQATEQAIEFQGIFQAGADRIQGKIAGLLR